MDTAALAMPRRPSHSLAPRAVVPVVSNARLAMLVVIAAESMLFAGLVGMYLVFRLSARAWPPPDQPRLPLAVTCANTAILLASLVPMTRAVRAVRGADRAALVRNLGWTALLGGVFLAVQGVEWTRLVHHGLTLSSGLYGATFYTLIGCHGVHVLAAVLWLTTVALLAARGVVGPERHAALEMCSMYWYFVCALWLVLFPLVYLS